MLTKLVFIFILLSFTLGKALSENEIDQIFASNSLDPDTNRNVTQLITSKGYPCDQYYVKTQDGFFLSLQRISHSKASPPRAGKPVVFLQHGIMDSSTTWVINFPEQSLAFILADAGFDVWLGNIRANRYSDRNDHLSPDSEQYWAFSWDEHASIDVPAMINFILQVTGKSNLSYIGHSQGTTMGYAAFVTNKQLAEKINIFVALAPVVYLQHPKAKLVKVMATFHVDAIIKFFGVKSFLPSTELLQYLMPHACDVSESLCKNIYCWVAGCELSSINNTRLPVIMSHIPSGTSVQNMQHWAQAVRSGAYQMYDFGSSQANEAHYNQPSPPKYNIANLMVKTAVFYGGKDPLADVEDVDYWTKLVPGDKLVYKRLIPEWGHGDFVWTSSPLGREVYDKVVDLIQKSQ